MTNEEKAREIIGGGCNKKGCRECGGSLSVAEGCVEFRHLKEMSEWKEKQMIEKACEWLEDMACYYAHWEYNGDTYEKEVVYDTEKLIKDFKKSMEE